MHVCTCVHVLCACVHTRVHCMHMCVLYVHACVCLCTCVRVYVCTCVLLFLCTLYTLYSLTTVLATSPLGNSVFPPGLLYSLILFPPSNLPFPSSYSLSWPPCLFPPLPLMEETASSSLPDFYSLPSWFCFFVLCLFAWLMGFVFSVCFWKDNHG